MGVSLLRFREDANAGGCPIVAARSTLSRWCESLVRLRLSKLDRRSVGQRTGNPKRQRGRMSFGGRLDVRPRSRVLKLRFLRRRRFIHKLGVSRAAAPPQVGMRENNYPEGVAQTGDRFVEPFQGTVMRVNATWGGAATRLTPGYRM